jgi:hypothetical protein
MAWEGKILLGKTWGFARQLLEDLSWLPRTVGTQLNYGSHVLLAQDTPSGKTIPGAFWRMFQEACKCDESIEGIVLKDPSGLLQFSSSKLADVPYMVKVRKPSKKYNM